MRQSVESLTPEQIWWRPNAESNSIGNLMLHLNGNVRQWVIDSFSGSESRRDRPAEFAARNGVEPSALVESLGTTVQEAAEVIGRLTEADLVRKLEIQGSVVTGLEAVYHVVEHFGMHYGQIVYITKQLRGEDLGFYRELNQTARTSGSHGSR
jgi:uncharacterized damage-inducible protein DinB